MSEFKYKPGSFVDDSVEKRMADAVIKGKVKASSPLYWLSKLNYDRDDSHPEHAVMRNQIKKDADIIRDAEYLKSMYENIGVKF